MVGHHQSVLLRKGVALALAVTTFSSCELSKPIDDNEPIARAKAVQPHKPSKKSFELYAAPLQATLTEHELAVVEELSKATARAVKAKLEPSAKGVGTVSLPTNGEVQVLSPYNGTITTEAVKAGSRLYRGQMIAVIKNPERW